MQNIKRRVKSSLRNGQVSSGT